MPNHRIYIETVYAEDLLELPANVHIRNAKVLDGNLILIVDSAEDLGSIEVDAVYASYEGENCVHLAEFTPRT